MYHLSIKAYFFFLFLISTIVFSEKGQYYDDRVMLYIDNKITDFRISDDLKTTSLSGINNFLMNYDVSAITQWLPKARSTDRDGNIYLNRINGIFYVIMCYILFI